MNTLLFAISYFTRIPVPKWVYATETPVDKAIRYLPLIGILVGSFGALILYFCQMLMSYEMAILLSMVATIIITGAFHEDGWADTCDGFGGGGNKNQVLTIMKDSRIGTYGTIGLIMVLLVKFQLLIAVTPGKIYFSLIAAHALSRMLPVLMAYTSQYAGVEDQSKSKFLAHKINWIDVAIAAVFALLPFYFLSWSKFFLSILLLALVFLGMRWFSHRRIGGFTGDVLGAMQQVAEIVIYISVVYIQDNY